MTRREETTPRFVGELHAEIAESVGLEHAVEAKWRRLGYGG